MTEPIIQVRDLGKRYRLGQYNARSLREEAARLLSRRGRKVAAPTDFWALRDVSFDVAPGEVLGIIGRNGAGKSTLLKLLSRVTQPTTGEIRVRGRVASLLEVGTGFHPELTGRENIFLNGAILGMNRAEIRRKFDEIVDFSDVEQFLDTPVKRYSSGMYVRLAFAVAAHLEPEILIVDEVLAVGDHLFQQKCLGKMQQVSREEGRTVLFVSHNLMAVQSLCSQLMILVKGETDYSGDVRDGVARYSQLFEGRRRPNWVASEIGTDHPAFSRVSVKLDGRQPAHKLRCQLEFSVPNDAPSFFLAVDVCDSALAPIMQALPEAAPFIHSKGTVRLSLEVDLPPLIPGHYALSFWIGSHYTNTFDHIERVLSFEIVDSPVPDRTFRHYSAYGALVPTSRYQFEEVEASNVG